MLSGLPWPTVTFTGFLRADPATVAVALKFVLQCQQAETPPPPGRVMHIGWQAPTDDASPVAAARYHSVAQYTGFSWCGTQYSTQAKPDLPPVYAGAQVFLNPDKGSSAHPERLVDIVTVRCTALSVVRVGCCTCGFFLTVL